MSGIKPCPYCGNEKPGSDVRYIGNICTGGRIVCHKCGVTGPYGNSLGEAAERWNGMPREEAAPVSYFETTPDRDRHLRTDWECSGCGERFSEYAGYGAMDHDFNVCPWCGRPIAEWIFKECQKGEADGRD